MIPTRQGAVLLLLIAGVAFPSVVGYHIEPVKAQWSGWTSYLEPNNYVSQQVVACWDSLDRVELFAGAKGNGGQYRAGVWLDGAEIMWSWGDRVADHAWIKFQNWILAPETNRLRCIGHLVAPHPSSSVNFGRFPTVPIDS